VKSSNQWKVLQQWIESVVQSLFPPDEDANVTKQDTQKQRQRRNEQRKEVDEESEEAAKPFTVCSSLLQEKKMENKNSVIKA
jgi:hypothetical protein